MRAARTLCIASVLALVGPAVFGQSPPAPDPEDLDVTMHVIVDPDAKVPDEIVRTIKLPTPAKPAGGATSPNAGKDGKNDRGKAKDPGTQGSQAGGGAREQGREFGQRVSEDAKKRSEEARHNNPSPPGKPPGKPPGRPPAPPGRPPTPGG
jgi:hypothetical protein